MAGQGGDSWKKNFIQYNPEKKRDVEKLREAGRRGAEALKKKRSQNAILRQVFALPLSEEDEMAKELDARGLPNNIAYASALALAKRAMRGDIDAYKTFRDTIGEKPDSTVQIEVGASDPRSWDMTTIDDSRLAEIASMEDDIVELPDASTESAVLELEAVNPEKVVVEND